MTQLSFGTVAPTSRRAVAYIIDALIAGGIGIVLAIILVVVGVSAGPEGMLAAIGIGAPVAWLLMVGWFIFYTVMQGGKGSIGMRAQGLRLAREADGAPLGFGRALLRNIIFGLSAAIVVGYFTPLFDGSGRFQGWHDKVAGSLMLDARVGGSAVVAPPTQAVPVPPRPSLPNAAAPIPPASDARPAVPGLAGPLPSPASAHSVPPVPGLAAPVSQPYAAPDLDDTLRGVSDLRQPSPSAASAQALIPAPQPPMPTPQPPTPAPQPPMSTPQPLTPAAPEVPDPLDRASTPATGEEALIAFVPGITQDGPPARNAPVQQDIPAAPADDAADIEDTRISIPGHRLVFTWDDGTRVTVSRRTLFGRNPAAEAGAVAVPVRDETLSLSKTHFEAVAEASGGWVTDRHSTNGTVIVRDGHRIVCTPGEQVRIRLGDAIEIGDRIVTVGGYA